MSGWNDDHLNKYFKKYRLAANGDVEECTMAEYSEFMDSEARIVGETFTAACRVSTVFLGIVHSGGTWFETMVFDRQPRLRQIFGHMQMVFADYFQRRYRTYGEAKAGHAEVVQVITAFEATKGNDIKAALDGLD